MTKREQARREAAVLLAEHNRRMDAIRATGREPTTLEVLHDIYESGNVYLRTGKA